MTFKCLERIEELLAMEIPSGRDITQLLRQARMTDRFGRIVSTRRRGLELSAESYQLRMGRREAGSCNDQTLGHDFLHLRRCD
jgi:hypothetical protein